MSVNKIILTAQLKARKEMEFDLRQYIPLGAIEASSLKHVAYKYLDTWISLDNDNNFNNVTARYVKFTAKDNTVLTVKSGVGYVAEKDESWRKIFNRKNIWVGGDGIYSFNLKDGNDDYNRIDAKTMFTFGDTLVGKINPLNKKRTDPLLMPNNTIAYLNGNGTDHKDIDFLINRNDHDQIVSFIDPNNPSMYDGTNPEHLVNYTRADVSKPYLSGYNPDKVSLLFDLSVNQHVQHIDLYNYFVDKDADSDVNNRGFNAFSISVSLDKLKWLSLGDFTLNKAQSTDDFERFDIHKPCRYIKITVPPKQGIGNHYDPKDQTETIFGLNKVFIYNDTKLITDISVEASSVLSKKQLDSWFWLQDGVVIDDYFYCLPLLIIPDSSKPEGLQFAVQGVSLIKAPIENGRINFDLHTQKNTPLYRHHDQREILYGAAILPNFKKAGAHQADGYIYVYGYKNGLDGNDLLVARVKPEAFEHIDTYEYYSEGEWVPDLLAATPLLKHISCEMSVSPITEGANQGQYLAVFQYNVNSPYVAYAIGETPWGPFTEPRIVYECEEPKTLYKSTYTYNAKAHPHLSTPNSILVSYNVNDYDMQHHYDNGEIYHPRFIRLNDLSLNDTELPQGILVHKEKPYMSMKQRRIIKHSVLHTVLISLSALFMFPFLWMLFTALKTPAELLLGTDQFLPKTPQWDNFRIAVTQVPFILYLSNSLLLVSLSIIGTLFSTTLTAYAFAKLSWPGRDTFFVIMLATMMIPIQVILIPSYILYAQIGWLGTRLPLIVPFFFGGGSAFYIFLLRQFFKGIPKDLTESAFMDGAGHFRIFWNIMLPLTKPALITISLFTFMFIWNDYFGPLIYLSNPDHWTLALGLRAFQTQYSGRFDLMMAAAILVMLPTLIIFFFAQKQFIEGITFSGIKG